MRTRALVLASLGALALAGGAAVLVAASDHDDSKALTFAFALTSGLTFVASGLVALWRRPENRTGLLLAAVGYLWFLGALTESNNDWVFSAGVALSSVAFGAFVHLLLAFPWGHLSRRGDAWLVAATYALVVGVGIAILLVDETPDSSCDGCRSMIAITDSQTASFVVELIATALAVALIGVVLTVVVRRFLHASGALRRLLGPVLVVGSLAIFIVGLQVVVAAFSEPAAEPLNIAFLAAFALVPFAFLAGVLRARLARSAVGELLLDLATGGTPLRDALARALHDPSLEVVYWLPERDIFVWHDGNEFHDEGGPRIARYVERNGQRIGAILHDPSLQDEPELVDAVAEAAGLWLENERLQADLRSQVDFLETVVNTAPSLLMSLDLEGRIVNFNTACARASGLDDAEAIRGRHFWDVFIAEEHRDGVRTQFEENPTHPPGEFENAFVNARGERLVIAWSTAQLLDDKGELRNLICGGLDVTERKLREVELARERDFLRTLADATPTLLIVVDDEGTVVGNSVNKGFERTLGWSDQEMLGRSFFSLFREDEGYFARLGLASAFNGVDPDQRISHWSKRAGGERVIAWTATPIVDGDGRSLALVVGRDVTEREQREADLRSSEERLRAVIEASPVAIVEYALDDTITRWNPAAERIFGWSAEEAIGSPPLHIPPGRAAERAERLRRVRAGEEYAGVEGHRARKDGSMFDVEVARAPLCNAKGEVVSHVALYMDISDRKRQEEEVRASRSRIVQAADDARRVLERNLHDGAQQRLVALSLSLRLAQSRLTSDPAAAGEILESARTELAQALDELRELARGIHPAILTDRGLDAAVQALASRSAIPVDVREITGDLPPAVEAAAYYVIAESLANVAKYAEASSVSVSVSRSDGHAVIEVADDGVGGADSSKGSGLRGLADRVEALSGRLAVESPSGRGTRVRAEIPC